MQDNMLSNMLGMRIFAPLEVAQNPPPSWVRRWNDSRNIVGFAFVWNLEWGYHPTPHHGGFAPIPPTKIVQILQFLGGRSPKPPVFQGKKSDLISQKVIAFLEGLIFFPLEYKTTAPKRKSVSFSTIGI